MSHQTYPLADKRPVTERWGTVTITDDFTWLEEANAPDTLSWVAEENAFTDRFFSHNPGVVEGRMAQLKAQRGGPHYTDVTRLGDYIYASREVDGNHCTVRLDGTFEHEQVLLDGSAFDDACIVYSVTPSPLDNGMAAFFVLYNGSPRPSLLLRNMVTGEQLVQMDGLFSYSWAPDGSCLYYSDAQAHPEKGTNSNYIRRYTLATGKTDVLYDCVENAVFCQVAVAADGTLFVKVCLNYHDVIFYHIDPATGNRTRVNEGAIAAFVYLGTIDGRHYILTDWQATRSRILSLDATAPVLQTAKEVVPQEGRILKGGIVLGDKLVTLYLDNVVSVLELRQADGKLLHPITLPDPMGALGGEGVLGHPASGDTKVLLSFESFLCPPTLLEYDSVADAIAILHQEGTAQTTQNMLVEQMFVTARDGTKVPAFVVRPKDLVKTGETPTLMYGYGGYGVTMAPWYYNPFIGLEIADWVSRGYIYVHCNLRGGGEYGTAWHLAGNMANKKNVFHDFIDITQAVIDQGWTKPEKIAICGGSNGGLLVTALATMRPDLFGAVIASVPHTDMIHFSRDDRGPMYITEYGDPNDPAQFAVLHDYSPYHNVKEGTVYPAMYVQTGEFDNNVPPYHGKKFAARMQHAAHASRPVLLRVLARGSHDRGAGEVFYRTTAEMQTFIAQALGCKL